MTAAAVGTLTDLAPEVNLAQPLTGTNLDVLLSQAGWPPELIPQALRVIECESHGHADSVGDSGNSLGLFQLWTGWFHEGENPMDAGVNAAVAWRVFNYDVERHAGDGWYAWTCKP